MNWEGVARDGSFIALLTSPIWVELSRFGYPYPPFDFNSGMRVRPVGHRICKELGLLADEEWLDKQLAAAEEGLNEGAEADCSDMSAEVLAELDRARAAYSAVLLEALEETENALTGITTAQRREHALQRALDAAESAADLAMQQYKAGLTDYQTILNTQRSLYNARETLQSNKADLATQLIALYRAMGGGWQPSEAVKQLDRELEARSAAQPQAQSAS